MKRIKEIGTEYNIIRICIKLAIFTSSFDIVGLFNIGGFNFRFCQLAILPVMILWLMRLILSKQISIPYGFTYLFGWITLQFAFCFRSPNLKNAFGYFMWLVFNTVTILSVCYFCGKAYSKEWLLKTYLDSFVFVSILGMMQLVLYAVGINFYVTQNWTARLARINGFSYEPSYYATYLLMGLVTYACLLIANESAWISKTKLQHGLVCVTVALILSSSRMGWLMTMFFIGCELFYHFIIKALTNRRIKKKTFLIIVLSLVIVAIGVFFVVEIIKLDFSMFTVGLGIGGGSTHSSGPRIEGLTKCVDIFKKSPVWGYSLGGVDPMIAKYNGEAYSTLHNGAAMSIVGEILVANGIVGLIPFIIYFFNLLLGKIHSKNITISNVIKALRVAMIFELAILCFNQNILRPYVWWHIAILSAELKY